ncbi:MAG: hypothetical protein AB2A00_07265 [Myxococcota bacterium]
MPVGQTIILDEETAPPAELMGGMYLTNRTFDMAEGALLDDLHDEESVAATPILDAWF